MICMQRNGTGSRNFNFRIVASLRFWTYLQKCQKLVPVENSHIHPSRNLEICAGIGILWFNSVKTCRWAGQVAHQIVYYDLSVIQG